jgi:aminoglycoside phosphotransferase family enzyme/predicted kinase
MDDWVAVSLSLPAGQAEVAAFLARLAGSEPVETHISAIYRGAETVWKLKKAVALGFLDFSQIESRRHFLERELALNAPFVPGLYRDVIAVTRGPDGVALGGDGPALDWVLRMALVPEADFLDATAKAGRLDGPLLTALADAVAAMHAAQPFAPMPDPAGRMRRVAEGNIQAARAAGLPAAPVDALRVALTTALDGSAPILESRGYLTRRAHGDLHLGNLLLWHGRPAPFDALEFDEGLATIDPGYDLAFLLMDLDRRVSRAASNQVMNRYVARTGDAGLAGALPVFLSLRALIRAHVEAARGRDGAPLLAAAKEYLQPGRPVVLAIGGLMGTGKSTLARAMAPGLGRAPGALLLSNDTVRKRLFGVAPEEKLTPAGYTPEAHAEVLATLLGSVRAAAAGGHAVIADATFLDPAARDAIEQSARQSGAAFLGIWLDAPLPVLEDRVAARRNDASDADMNVLRHAAAGAVPPSGWLHIDASDATRAEREVQSALIML